MGKIQSKASTAQNCANAFALAAFSLTAASEVTEDKSSNYIGNDLIRGLLTNEKSLSGNFSTKVTTFVGLVQSVSHEFDATDQQISQEIKQTSAQLNSWQSFGKESK